MCFGWAVLLWLCAECVAVGVVRCGVVWCTDRWRGVLARGTKQDYFQRKKYLQTITSQVPTPLPFTPSSPFSHTSTLSLPGPRVATQHRHSQSHASCPTQRSSSGVTRRSIHHTHPTHASHALHSHTARLLSITVRCSVSSHCIPSTN